MKAVYKYIIFAFASLALSIDAGAQSSIQSDGLHLNSTVKESNGQPWRYTRTVEAYTEGEYVIKQVTKHADVDFVLVLDNSGSMVDKLNGESKITTLKRAACNFVDLVQSDAVNYNANHRISIIQFNYPNYPKSNYLDSSSSTDFLSDVAAYTEVNDTDLSKEGNSGKSVKTRVRNRFTTFGAGHESDAAALKDNINAMAVGGSTAIDYGMTLAKLMLENFARTDATVSKVVIVFTDGAPTHNGGLAYSKYKGGYGVADDAIEQSLAIKKSGAMVYCINMNTSDNNRSYHEVFMECLSSNYPNAGRFFNKPSAITEATQETLSNYNLKNSKVGAKNTDGKNYFIDVTTQLEQLNQAFVDIGTVEVYRDTRFPLTEDAVLMDVLSDGFELSPGAVATVKVAKPHEVRLLNSTQTTFYFDNEKDDAEATKDVTVSMEGNKVKISGFDFQKYFVGTKTNNETTVRDNGLKLIVHYPVQVVSSNPGGMALPVNTDASGMYKSSADLTSPDNMAGSLRVNTIDGPNVVIVKKGLAKGESAVFRVHRIDDTGYVGSGGTPVAGEPDVFLVATQGDGEYAVTSRKFSKPGRYQVEETSWNWVNRSEPTATYSKDDGNSEVSGNTITRNLNADTQDAIGGLTGTLFIFESAPDTSAPSHAENLKKEAFN